MVVRGRRVWVDKAAVLAGGAEVEALRYQRASADKKQQGKSVADQDKLNRGEIVSRGWRSGRSFTDNNRSASRYAKKEREDFEQLMEAIRGGRGDVLVMWELARGQRDLAVYVQIRDTCVGVGLFFWLVGGALYDLRDRNDRMSLGMQAVQSEFQAEYIRDNVLRGVVGAAERGLPHSRTLYGFRRVYDSRTRVFVRQELDTEVRTAVAADGSVSTFTAVGIVREIFESVAAGVALIRIAERLTVRGVPSPGGGEWLRHTVRRTARNPSYIGKRALNGVVVADAVWPAVVAEETYWACARILSDPARTTTRPSRAVWLLSYLAKCGVCGSPVQARATAHRTAEYSCLNHRCVAIRIEVLDEYVQRVLVAWLSRKDVYDAVARQGAAGDEQAAGARAEASQLRTELEQWRAEVEHSDVSAELAGRKERSLLQRIRDADERAKEATVPPILRGLIGRDAQSKWAALGADVAVKRDVIRLVAGTITVEPVEKEPGVPMLDSRVPLSDRIRFSGLLGAGRTGL